MRIRRRVRDFLPNDYLSIPSKLHKRLDSDPTSRPLSRSVSFLVGWPGSLDCRNKINARENDEGNRDERMCARFVAPCKSFTRESQAKFEARWLGIAD